MKVLILAGASTPGSEGQTAYPLCLAEKEGIPLIERIINACAALGPVDFGIVLRRDDIRRFHLDNIVKLLAPDIRIFPVNQDTQGAACSALLAVDHIDNEDELLILNANELLDVNFSQVVKDFRSRQLDAGVITFPSVHPRYSFVQLDEDGFVVAAAEKNPISRNATAGFFYFSQGKKFVQAAQRMISKAASVNNLFYICPSFNELILEGARIGTHRIEATSYQPLKTEQEVFVFQAQRLGAS